MTQRSTRPICQASWSSFDLEYVMGTTFLSCSEEATFEFARKLAESLSIPAHVLLLGELGAGKTTFARGLAAGFGLERLDEVSSPTFTLVNRYQCAVTIYHIDLYRVAAGDLYDLGLEEIFEDPRAAVVVEWAERLGDYAPGPAVRVSLSYVDSDSRQIVVERIGPGIRAPGPDST